MFWFTIVRGMRALNMNGLPVYSSMFWFTSVCLFP